MHTIMETKVKQLSNKMDEVIDRLNATVEILAELAQVVEDQAKRLKNV